jgi:hypothetical protein
MICQTAHDWLLQADPPIRWEDSPIELAAHIRTCAECQTMVAKVARLDCAWRDLPLPAGASAAKAKFLEQSLNQPSARERNPRRRWIVSAGVVAALSLGLLLAVWLAAPAPTAQASSDVVIEKLIDWNLQLTESGNPEERAKLFDQQAVSLKADLDKPIWNEDDRKLARSLYDNGIWLVSNSDALEEADRFAGMADQLLVRLETAATHHDGRRTDRLLAHYERVSARGIDAKLDRLKAPAGDQQKKLERIQAREQRRTELLQQLHDQFPDLNKKELKRLIEQSKKKQHPKHGKK